MLKKIVVIGPESTGKSTLCKQLATHYQTRWVPEYARAFLLENGTEYTYHDLSKIAAGQMIMEEEITSLIPEKEYLFIDTDLQVIRVWSEFVFHKCENHILKQIAQRSYDMYLLCNTDIPWVKDELREYPDLHTRNTLYHYYKDTLINQQVPWIEVKGSFETRLQHAVKAINSLFD